MQYFSLSLLTLVQLAVQWLAISCQDPDSQNGAASWFGCQDYSLSRCRWCAQSFPNPAQCENCVRSNNNCCFNPNLITLVSPARSICRRGPGPVNPRTCDYIDLSRCLQCRQFGFDCARCVLRLENCCVSPLNPNNNLIANQFCGSGFGNN